MVEKYYIVECKQLLDEIDKCNAMQKQQREFIKDFFERHGIDGKRFLIRAEGACNAPFKEENKRKIQLHIIDTENNREKFEEQLKASSVKDCAQFRKNSNVLKAFQDECIEKQIPVNILGVCIGDYFKELFLGGYSICYFFFENKFYLRLETSRYDTITPIHDGFVEIKASEYFLAMEKFEESKEE